MTSAWPARRAPPRNLPDLEIRALERLPMATAPPGTRHCSAPTRAASSPRVLTAKRPTSRCRRAGGPVPTSTARAAHCWSARCAQTWLRDPSPGRAATSPARRSTPVETAPSNGCERIRGASAYARARRGASGSVDGLLAVANARGSSRAARCAAGADRTPVPTGCNRGLSSFSDEAANPHGTIVRRRGQVSASPSHEPAQGCPSSLRSTGLSTPAMFCLVLTAAWVSVGVHKRIMRLSRRREKKGLPCMTTRGSSF